MSFSNIPRPRKEPLSTEEYLRSIFKAQESSSKNRDYTPRTLQPDGSMDTEDFLREVVFGVERQPVWAPQSARAKPVADAPMMDPQSSDARAPGFRFSPTPPATLKDLEAALSRVPGTGTALFPGFETLEKKKAALVVEKNAFEATVHLPDENSDGEARLPTNATGEPPVVLPILQRLSAEAGTPTPAGGGLYAAARTAAGRTATDAGGSAGRQPASHDAEFWGGMSQKLAQSGLKTVEEHGAGVVDANAYKWAMGGDAKALEYLRTQATKYPDDAALQRSAVVAPIVAGRLAEFNKLPWEQRNHEALRRQMQQSIDGLPGLSPDGKKEAFQDALVEVKKHTQSRRDVYESSKGPLITGLSEDTGMSDAETTQQVDVSLREYKAIRGVNVPGKEPQLDYKDLIPERNAVLGQVMEKRLERLQMTPGGAEAVRQKVLALDPPLDKEVWKKTTFSPVKGLDRAGLSQDTIDSAEKYAGKYDVPPTLMLMILSGESDGLLKKKNDQSSATGLMQLTDDTVKELKRLHPEFANYSSDNEQQNMEMGAAYLRMGLERSSGDWLKAMIGYKRGLNELLKMDKQLDAPELRQRLLTYAESDRTQLQKDLGLKDKDAEYIWKQVSRTKLRDPNFQLPEPSVWYYLPVEKKRTLRNGGGE